MAAGDALDIVKAALRISRRDETRTTDQTQGLYWLNQGHRSVLTDATPWTFLEVEGQVTATADETDYTFASLAASLGPPASTQGVDVILGITDDTNGGQPLRVMPWKALERLAMNTVGDPSALSPIYYTTIGEGRATAKVKLWPAPQDAIELGVKARLAIIDLASTDFPLIPGSHAPAVLTPYVAMRMWQQNAGNDARQEVQLHQAMFQDAVARLRDAYGSAREENILFAEPYDDGRGGYWP